jgi:hypothetical protein
VKVGCGRPPPDEHIRFEDPRSELNRKDAAQPARLASAGDRDRTQPTPRRRSHATGRMYLGLNSPLLYRTGVRLWPAVARVIA